MPTALHLGIQPPNFQCDGGGKWRPEQVWRQEDGCCGPHARELAHRPSYRYPERHDIEKAGANAPKTEESGREQRIQEKLRGISTHGHGPSAMVAFAPDHPGSDGHRDIESGPYRAEPILRRRPFGL